MENTKDATVGAEKNLEGQNKEAVTYTQEEFEKKLQSESDRRVNEALETARKNWQKEEEARIQKERDEAAEFAKMTEAQRAKAQMEKEKEAFEAEREKFNKERLELEVIKTLSEKGLNPKLSSFLMGEDADSSMKNVEVFEEVFAEEVEKAVKLCLSGSAPKVGTTKPESSVFDVAKYASEKRKIRS